MVRHGAEDAVEEPLLPVEIGGGPDELAPLLPELLLLRPEFLLRHPELLCRRLGLGAHPLADRDVLPDRESPDHRAAVPDGSGGGEDVQGPAVRRRDHERDIDRLLARECAPCRQIGRHQRRAVGGVGVEDADHGGERAAGQGSAGERFGQVVRLGDPAVGVVEERRLPDGGEGEGWNGHGAGPTASYADYLHGDG